MAELILKRTLIGIVIVFAAVSTIFFVASGVGDPAVLVDRETNTIWVAATWSHGNRSWRGSGPGPATR